MTKPKVLIAITLSFVALTLAAVQVHKAVGKRLDAPTIKNAD